MNDGHDWPDWPPAEATPLADLKPLQLPCSRCGESIASAVFAVLLTGGLGFTQHWKLCKLCWMDVLAVIQDPRDGHPAVPEPPIQTGLLATRALPLHPETAAAIMGIRQTPPPNLTPMSQQLQQLLDDMYGWRTPVWGTENDR